MSEAQSGLPYMRQKILVLTALFLIKSVSKAHFPPCYHNPGRKPVSENGGKERGTKSLFLTFYFYFFIFTKGPSFFPTALQQRGKERGRQRETQMGGRSIDWPPPLRAPAGEWGWGLVPGPGVSCICSQTGDHTHSPGMCPDQESNLHPFG